MLTRIEGFTYQFRFLSNFEFVKVMLDGVEYPSTEHAYQAAKTLDPEIREKFRALPKPNSAKNLGRKIKVREDWDEVKDSVMLDLTRQKYAQEPYRTLLLETGEAYIEETNYWNDRYWGVCGGMGLNKLGHILMMVRKELANR